MMQSYLLPLLTSKQQGMGVGLSISRSIIESHSGHLGVHANTDSGVTFTVELPVVAALMTTRIDGEVMQQQLIPVPDATVYIVDDDTAVLESITRLVQSCGWKTTGQKK